MLTDIVKLDLLDGGSFKRWQKKPWLNPVNVSSSEMTISFDVATSSMLCRVHSWTYIKIIPVLGNFGKLSRNASSRKTQQVRNLLFLNLTYNTGKYLAQNKYAKVIGNLIYGNNLDKVHLSECGSEAASYELKGLALKHSEKPRYRPKASFNGSAQSGLNEREEGYA
ncbi:hypothetical protein Tco_0318101 [Tanacetum coccineum]